MTASQEDYLKSIYILILHKNEARVTDIADYLQVSKASVNRALKSLKELGLVDYETYGEIKLTEKGKEEATNIIKKHNVLKAFLIQILNVNNETAEEEAKKMEEQLRKQSFDLNDYLAQLRQVKKMGSFSSILKMIPGMGQIKNLKVDDNEFNRIEAIICSMTAKERRNPKLLNGSRRLRIAKGSGTTVQEINKFMQTFETTQKMMKKIKSGKGMRNMMKNLNMNDLKDFKM